MKALEARVGVRLLARTTRSVAPTEAGERLLATISPRFEEIEQALAVLGELRDKPAGTIRITAGEHAARAVLQPGLARLLPAYPEIRVEVIVDYGLVDIVAEGFDAGVRLGEQVAKDMIALRIGPDMRMAVVGSPAYFDNRPMPRTPQDLTEHNCINMRMPTYGGLYVWEFEKDGRELRVRVDGQLVFNTLRQRLDSARQGLGLAYLPEDVATPCIRSAELVRVLEDWCAPFSGYHLYYPSRRHSSPAFSLMVETLRYKGA
ncbi:LysR family transcriptional regulator [Phenylobacterium sp. J367]|uniref:LysR family transcriptional regulator n=1 Tax=Phenylobacterium sp. J367 TaxID=2898435 RepID=UPI002150A00E|nr:LysR family transcriptional regulator [Phenylobacterium sp. J367]MCR5879541.1 LysR substrate-binding domain-containing protein [Phenylobacterium sp. J367]